MTMTRKLQAAKEAGRDSEPKDRVWLLVVVSRMVVHTWVWPSRFYPCLLYKGDTVYSNRIIVPL